MEAALQDEVRGGALNQAGKPPGEVGGAVPSIVPALMEAFGASRLPCGRELLEGPRCRDLGLVLKGRDDQS
eukprot:10467849-Alexandrium_andersonii.AAC.1